MMLTAYTNLHLYDIKLMSHVLSRALYCQLSLTSQYRNHLMCIMHTYITINALLLNHNWNVWDSKFEILVLVSHTISSINWIVGNYMHRHIKKHQYEDLKCRCSIVRKWNHNVILYQTEQFQYQGSIVANCSSWKPLCLVVLSFCPLALRGDRPAELERLLL